MNTIKNRHDGAVRRAVSVGLVVPGLLGGAAVAWQLAAIDDLTQELVTHWGTDGPDGFGPAWVYPLLTIVGGVIVPMLLATSAVRSLARGERSPMLRLMPALAASVGALFAVLSTGFVITQVGPALEIDVVLVLVSAFAAAVAIGALAWAVQPSQDEIVPASTPVRAIRTAPTERVVWIGRAELGKGAAALLVVASVLLVALAVWVWALGDAVAAAIVTGVAVLVAMLASAMTVFHVRADRSGLTVRSALGVPRFAVSADDIAHAAVVDVSGLAQFGGWGVRVIPGATGVILRNGQALEITRASGRRLVVTLDDAVTVAAVLNTVRVGAGSGVRDADQG